MKKNNLTSDFIAIDTNVFEHLFNPEKNVNDHIAVLLRSLASGEVKLIGDTEGRIAREYENRLGHFFDGQDNPVKITHQNYIDILRYWFRPETHEGVAVDKKGSLMRAIREIVDSGDIVDRTFVYVAIQKDRILVTNDRRDIIDIGKRPGKRRQELRRLARKSRKKHADILTSAEACNKI